MPSKNGTKPRIITRTVSRLRKLAAVLEANEGDVANANRLRAWADELDGYDARETRLDPTKRRKATRAKK